MQIIHKNFSHINQLKQLLVNELPATFKLSIWETIIIIKERKFYWYGLAHDDEYIARIYVHDKHAIIVDGPHVPDILKLLKLANAEIAEIIKETIIVPDATHLDKKFNELCLLPNMTSNYAESGS